MESAVMHGPILRLYPGWRAIMEVARAADTMGGGQIVVFPK